MDEQPVRKKGPTNTLGDGGEGCDMDVLLKQLLGTVLRRCRVRSVNRRSFFLAEPMAALAVVSSLASACLSVLALLLPMIVLVSADTPLILPPAPRLLCQAITGRCSA